MASSRQLTRADSQSLHRPLGKLRRSMNTLRKVRPLYKRAPIGHAYFIGDAVFCTDICGKITYLNLVAQTMTGWSLAEVRQVILIFPSPYANLGWSMFRDAAQKSRLRVRIPATACRLVRFPPSTDCRSLQRRQNAGSLCAGTRAGQVSRLFSETGRRTETPLPGSSTSPHQR